MNPMLYFRVWLLALVLCSAIGITGCGFKAQTKNEVQLNPDLPGLPSMSMKKEFAANSERSIYIHHKPSSSHVLDSRHVTPNHTLGAASDASTPAMTHYAIRLQEKKPVRGIYVSGWVAGSEKRLNQLIELIDRTDLNAMVIDVKNDYGKLTYRSKLPQIKSIGADNKPSILNIHRLLSKLKKKDIYVIGRIVTFKDPLFALKYPSMALQSRSGGVWRDSQGNAWLDPYQPAVRSYNQEIAKEAAAIGFDEIQFDYVRFPDNEVKVDREVSYNLRKNKTKSEIISEFLRESRTQIHKKGAKVSADVFGLVTSSTNDMGIGQSWRTIASSVDVISPMTYPSHYSSGMYGEKEPDLAPAIIIGHAMKDAQERNGNIKREWKQHPAEIRPWLQSFTATWVHPHQSYKAEQIHSQVEAARAQGVRQFLLWSSNCKYDYRS